jgi:hemerythrin
LCLSLRLPLDHPTASAADGDRCDVLAQHAGTVATLSLDVLHFLKDWLIKHIQGSDQKYRSHLNAKGIN